jgi:hypothetical protein
MTCYASLFVPALAAGEKRIDQVVAIATGRRGTLYLTDRRLIFEWSEGLVSKKYLQLGIALADIQAVNAHHPRFGGGEVQVITKDSNNGFHATHISFGLAMAPETWQAKINALLMAPTSQQSPNQPAMIVEKEVIKIPCRYCKALLDPYRHSVCPHCGAPIHIA